MTPATESAFDFSTTGEPIRWDSPGGALAVILDPETAASLRSQIMEAFLSLPKRGAEAGGFLLGHTESGDPPVLRVEAFEAVPCEHRYGPSYLLSEDDRRNQQEAIARLRAQKEPAVLGFYRSYTGTDAALDASDQELIRKYFAGRPYLGLLIQPLSPRECVARFVAGGELPVEAAIAAAAPPPAPAEAVAATPIEPDPRPRNPKPPEPPPVREPPPARPPGEPPREARLETLPPLPKLRRVYDEEAPAHRRRFWLPFLLCVVLSIAAAFVYELWQLATEPRWTPLGLDASRNAGDILLRWNASSAAVQGASGAVLSIADGDSRKQVQLGPPDLRAGHYAYHAEHGDVLFRLYLRGAGVSQSGDSLRLVSAEPRLPAPPPVPAAAPAAPAVLAPAAPKPAAQPEPPHNTAKPAVPPRIVHQVQPGIPAGIRSRIHGTIVVPVEVDVNAAGRVTHSSADRGGDGLYQYLADQALQAARLWSFEPARTKNGRKVEAEKTIYFVFRN